MFEGIKKFAAEAWFDKKTLNHSCNLHNVAHNNNNFDNNDNKDDNDNDFFYNNYNFIQLWKKICT